MAERRMFAKSIISSGKFLRMPPTSRLLYYDLGMAADDDGIVEAYTVIKQTNATEDDLRVLISKGYARVLNEDLVVYICDWNVNNSIRTDRYHKSIYKDILVKLDDGNQMTTNRQPIGNQMDTEVRLGKVRLGKVSNNTSPAEPKKTAYGEYGNVKLTEKQKEKLEADYGAEKANDAIRFLDEYIQEKGYKSKDHNLSIRRWVFNALEERKAKEQKEDPWAKAEAYMREKYGNDI